MIVKQSIHEKTAKTTITYTLLHFGQVCTRAFSRLFLKYVRKIGILSEAAPLCDLTERKRVLFHQCNAALNAIVRQINRKTCPGLLLKQFAEIIAGNAELLRNLADRQLVGIIRLNAAQRLTDIMGVSG